MGTNGCLILQGAEDPRFWPFSYHIQEPMPSIPKTQFHRKIRMWGRSVAVTPLVARVNSADLNQGWLCRSLLPPSQQHVHPSWSCIFKEAYRQVFGKGHKSSCGSQIDQTSSQGPYANQLISTLPDHQLKHLTLIQSPLSFASEIYFLPFFVGLNILIPLLSFSGTLKEKENRLLLNLFSLTRPIILVKHLNS